MQRKKRAGPLFHIIIRTFYYAHTPRETYNCNIYSNDGRVSPVCGHLLLGLALACRRLPWRWPSHTQARSIMRWCPSLRARILAAHGPQSTMHRTQTTPPQQRLRRSHMMLNGLPCMFCWVLLPRRIPRYSSSRQLVRTLRSSRPPPVTRPPRRSEQISTSPPVRAWVLPPWAVVSLCYRPTSPLATLHIGCLGIWICHRAATVSGRPLRPE